MKTSKSLMFVLIVIVFAVLIQPVSAAAEQRDIPFLPEYPNEDWGPPVVVEAIIPYMPCDFIGNEILGSTLRVGDTVSAEDPNGVLCGSCVVENNGRYGFLRTRPDDPNTAADEGAEKDDKMTFYINDPLAATNVAIWLTGKTVRADIASAEEVTAIDPDQIGPDELYSTLQDAIDDVSTDVDVVYLSEGAYFGDVILTDGKSIIGQNPYSMIPYPVVLEGRISCLESDSTLKYIQILYRAPESYLSFANTNYEDLKLLPDAGVTAVDSDITVQNCIIMPDLDAINLEGEYDPSLEYYGKGIQIWNMYRSADKHPRIVSNLILSADTGIYLYSQAFGGAIKGEIISNTLDENRYGISLRMHREDPRIEDNILTNCPDSGIMYAYEDGSLLDDRRANVIGNLFYENYPNLWCDSLEGEVPPTGEGNIYDENPDYEYTPDFDYPVYDGKGFMLE